MKPNRHLPLLILAAFLGCSGDPASAPLGPPPPLTVEQWKTLPVEEKYDAGTFERLKDADPTLQSPRAWDKFMREVVVPERKIDIPPTT